ncbi:hypothetical protein VQ643_13640 [Pseudomonas sp. F1_0610]|uniref:hypothetical protein n=1 Tax=Pseudomonas sp. F1_0610 TaxID=3114284 RepID=UPI0039C0CE43
MNTLSIRCIERTPERQNFMLFIDEQSLDSLLNIDHCEDMRFSNFDLDIFPVDKQRFPDYNHKAVIINTIAQFLGQAPIFTQFGSNRLVIYRCHCGSDYCGVISCDLLITQDSITWANIRYEDGSDSDDAADLDEIDVTPIPQLVFAKTQYEQAFANYFQQHVSML